MTNGFAIFADAAVIYDGRATSTLQRGRYLIISKPDGSIMIHGGALIAPLNYQGAKSRLSYIKPTSEEFVKNTKLFKDKPKRVLISTSKKEKLTIGVYSILEQIALDSWSTHSIELKNSEQELCDKIIANISTYLPNIQIISIETEKPTKYGNIDIFVTANDGFHIIEVKRKHMGVQACGQVARYALCFAKKKTHQYIAGPSMSSKATEYCKKHKIRHIAVNFEDNNDTI